jgi:hypothetical protein
MEGHDHALILQGLDHLRVVGRCRGVERRIVVAVVTSHFHAVDGDLFDVALVHIRHELREVDLLVLLSPATGFDHLPEKER